MYNPNLLTDSERGVPSEYETSAREPDQQDDGGGQSQGRLQAVQLFYQDVFSPPVAFEPSTYTPPTRFRPTSKGSFGSSVDHECRNAWSTQSGEATEGNLESRTDKRTAVRDHEDSYDKDMHDENNSSVKPAGRHGATPSDQARWGTLPYSSAKISSIIGSWEPSLILRVQGTEPEENRSPFDPSSEIVPDGHGEDVDSKSHSDERFMVTEEERGLLDYEGINSRLGRGTRYTQSERAESEGDEEDYDVIFESGLRARLSL